MICGVVQAAVARAGTKRQTNAKGARDAFERDHVQQYLAAGHTLPAIEGGRLSGYGGVYSSSTDSGLDGNGSEDSRWYTGASGRKVRRKTSDSSTAKGKGKDTPLPRHGLGAVARSSVRSRDTRANEKRKTIILESNVEDLTRMNTELTTVRIIHTYHSSLLSPAYALK